MSKVRINENKMLKEFILLTLQIAYIQAYAHEKPIAKTVWQQRCNKNTVVLNDCNWCFCNENHQFTCKARVCTEIDMFGHFNDAIRDISVGMEGHGPWRSADTPCEPGVHYQRNGLLCVCSEDGSWPSPVCRDIFRILHSVQITGENVSSSIQTCSPSKLHLIDCNVCLCPSSGHVDPKLCTGNKCTEKDPITSDPLDISTFNDTIDEVYADCLQDRKYKLGCRNCVCLRNNRLLCGKCKNNTKNDKIVTRTNSYCNVAKAGEIFYSDCNLCYCDNKDLIYCTTKRCINGLNKIELKKQLSHVDTKLVPVERPIEDEDCSPGTKYKKDCNSCYCIENNGAKVFGCTLKQCSSQVDIQSDCVNGTMYEVNCLVCHCEEKNGVKRQSCKVNERCTTKDVFKEVRSNNLYSLHGYCEPLHIYKKDCNTCRCLSDGKTITCTSKVCEKKTEPIVVEMLPVIQHNGLCPEGHTYKIDCNQCVCLSNGNTICTTARCKGKQ